MILASHRRVPHFCVQRGMTLVEVLVTLVLISVGLLGVAALQMASLKNNQDAYVRSQASVLAGDILDRIRADVIGFRAGRYDVGFNETGQEGTTAGRDLAAWQEAIDQLLPGGGDNSAGRIERDAATNVVTVTLRWSERPLAPYRQDDAEETEEEEGEEGEDEDLRLSTFQTRSEI